MRDKNGVQAVHLTFDIIEEIMAAKKEIGVSELTARLDSNKGTVFRHLQTLVDRGYLSQDPKSLRYRLGTRAHLLGQAAMGSMDLLAIGTEALTQLQTATQQTVVLSSIFPKSVTVLNTIMGTGVLEIGVRAGSELPFHASAQGKVAVAFCRQGVLTALRRRPLEKFTAHTITDVAELERELPQIRAQGWASAFEEMLLGINGIAAPIFDNSGECVASIAIVGSVQYVREQPTAAQLEALLKATGQVSNALGYTP